MQGAARSAAEIGQSRLAKGDTSDIGIELRGERDQRVFTVTASMQIERHDPPAQEASFLKRLNLIAHVGARFEVSLSAYGASRQLPSTTALSAGLGHLG